MAIVRMGRLSAERECGIAKAVDMFGDVRTEVPTAFSGTHTPLSQGKLTNLEIARRLGIGRTFLRKLLEGA